MALRTGLSVVAAAACAAAMGGALLVTSSGGTALGQVPPGRSAPSPMSIPLNPTQVQLLEQTLADADSQGLDPQSYEPAGLNALLQSSDPQVRQSGQTQLVARTLDYARAVHSGRLPTAAFLDDWGLKPRAYDPGPDFVQAVQQDQLKAWLESLPPPYTGYEGLRQGLQLYRQIAARGGWKPISEGPPLQPGAMSPRVLEVRARMAAEDPQVQPSDSLVYDPALVEAVKRAQRRYGLEDNGVVSGQTLEALNVSIDERIGQILANMERWRWLPAELPTERIQVNVAAAILTVFHADTPVLSMRAVTGRPGDETPMLTSKVESIVLNPPWNVPSSIAAKELWPKERAHPGYFAAHDFVVVRDGDGVRLQQRAGDSSALGRIKFDFPNNYGVYLHDTPSRGLFSREGRLASHGCVRLQKPRDLALLVMQGDPVWTPEQIDATIASGKTVRAPLPQPISVYLLYWTAYMGTDGMMNFRDDPYGWDEELMNRLRTADAAGQTA
ncbi:MAG TPA: L,D-transpeptidase family protein [Caulobacteraceae bacterium]|nr:L,D-transpeptidase family protein [Caulobacteraceae bacterium]